MAESRQYIASGHVTSLTDFFEFPNEDNSTIMVYNGTISGLNELIWVPRFPIALNEHLPPINSG